MSRTTGHSQRREGCRKFLIFNQTDGVCVYPHAVSRGKARRMTAKLVERYRRQGYYASVRGASQSPNCHWS